VYRAVCLATLLCLGLSSPVGAQTASVAKTDTAVAKSDPAVYASLIEQLGSIDYRKRDEAAFKLRAEGVKALPALREALNHPDPEVRRSVHDLVPALETAALLAPRRVTLKVSNKPMREVLNLIEKQSGYKIDTWGAGNRNTCSFDFTDLPFWEALDIVCQGTGMVLQQNYGADHIQLHAQEAHVPYVRYDGPFRLVPTGFQQFRNIEFGLVGKGAGTTNRNDTLTLSFTVFSEPRLPLLGMGEVRLEAAYDSDKNSMLPGRAGMEDNFDPRFGFRGGRWTSRYGMGNRMMSLQSQVTLSRPSDKALGVKVIRGRLPVTLLAEQTPVPITSEILKAKGVRTKIDTTSFHIEDVTQPANKQVMVKMTVSEASENPHDYTWMSSLYQRIELQDDKGNKFMVVGNGWGNNSPGSVQMTTTFAPPGTKAGPPTKLIYYRWNTVQHEIAFEFKDLPLP
jgi:hypothetical protein